MSLENFFTYYPPSPELPDIVAGEQKRLRGIETPYEYLADRLIGHAHDEIKEHSNRFDSPLTREDANELFAMTKNACSTIVNMNVIKGMWECATQGYFEHDTLLSRINTFFSGTPLERYKRPEWLTDDTEIIDPQHQAKLQKALSENPSGAVFYHEPNLLPKDVRRFLNEGNLLQFDYTYKLIEQWDLRVQYLTNKLQTPTLLAPYTEFNINDTYKNQLNDLLKGLDF